MSHFTRVEVQLFCLDTLKKAIEAMGMKEAKGEKAVRSFGNQMQHADLVVDTGCGYNIGLAMRAKGADIVADWDLVERRTDWSKERFIRDLKHHYSYFKVKEKVEAAGFTVVEERNEDGQGVTLRVRRWG